MSDPEIEAELARLVPKPMPTGLRERVLRSAYQSRRKAALTPRMRVAGVACVILFIVVLGAGSLAEKRESARLSALLDGRPRAGPAALLSGELAEMAGLAGGEAERLAQLCALASSAESEMKGSPSGADPRAPKGWSAYEISENLD